MIIATFLLALPLVLSYPGESPDLEEWMTPQEQRQMGINKLNDSEKKMLVHWIEASFDEKLRDQGTARLTIRSSSKKSRSIELNDGSLWEIHHDDSERASMWKSGEKVKIITGDDKRYPYLFVLVPHGEVARAKLVSKPLPIDGNDSIGKTHWIDAVTANGMKITLEDGTTWDVLPADKYIAKEWIVGDNIKVYKTESVKTPYVLVNTFTGQKIRVKKVDNY
ncbi:MAG: hypothetical protein HN411_00265 [Waddliaceae bacterium]|jgi:hypothetical protein|nr:hypothetical protein [Waddliaceae bacterium]MBT3578849.1 hypothetical protein [Waddliaceae bacterium]MBT4445288.1 hypothetical protein [Waddliaceae bacterium]MBT6928747.1 hypothetical protein [Waddliaceae bacterium]MBT7263942.1 hypothetical protein [Waddliaceae bacterium]